MADYFSFHRIQIANRDVDPVYPVLKAVGDRLSLSTEDRLRLVFLHVAYYDIGSALTAFEITGDVHYWFKCTETKLPCGTERRRHRMGDNLRNHLASLQTRAFGWQGLEPWLTHGLDDDARGNWKTVSERLMQVDGNGRWAAFKTCEMLREVCGLPLEAPDMGHANSSGPRKGLGLLFAEARVAGNSAEVIAGLDRLSVRLVEELRGAGAEASLATAETTLCDFHSMWNGRYYPGLDIDVMHEQIAMSPMSPEMRREAYLAREAALPLAYLGEEGGWQGVDVKRKRIYRMTGEIVTRG
jgi:hypothetical protein